MGIKFATDEWGKALMAAVNSSEAYAKAASNWSNSLSCSAIRSPTP